MSSQCICGSSGLPVWSVQWYPSVLTKSGLEVIGSGNFTTCNPLCIQLVWWELFELNWFHLNCHPKYTKSMMLISKVCTELNLQWPVHFLITVPPSCHFKLAWMLLCYMCLGVWEVFKCRRNLSKFLQWHFYVGQFQLSFISGVPVYPANIRRVAQWYPSVHWVNQWHSSVHWTSQCALAQGKGTLVSGEKHQIQIQIQNPSLPLVQIRNIEN